MSIKLKHCLISHSTKFNNENHGFDIVGQFDSIIQPVFPIGIANLCIYLAFEGLDKISNFEIRLNSPTDELIMSGDVEISDDTLGFGKKVINIEKFAITELGEYTLDILEKTPNGVNFLTTETLFITSYPPKRVFKEGEVEAILNSKEEIIKTIKSSYQPLGIKTPIYLQLNLDTNEKLEEGHILFPDDNKIILEETEYDLTGLRREMEWMFGRPMPKNPPLDEQKEKIDEQKEKKNEVDKLITDKNKS